MNKQTILTAVLSVALAVSLTLNVVLCLSRVSTVSVESPSDSSVPTVTTTQEPDTEAVTEITTPYGELLFPEEYTAYLKHEGITENGVYIHTFFMIHGEGTQELFSVYFGDASRGTPIGTVDTDGKQTAVTVTSTSFEPDDTWSESDSNRFISMQMAINDVIESVQSWENFRG